MFVYAIVYPCSMAVLGAYSIFASDFEQQKDTSVHYAEVCTKWLFKGVLTKYHEQTFEE